MKTKLLRYSLSHLNQVVWHYAELEKVGDGVYTYLKSKDQYREQDDLIAVVLRLENVFFEYGNYNRRFLANQNVADTGAKVLANFHRTVEQTMQEGKHLQILFVRIYEEMGRDTAPLLRYREERRLRLKQENEERQRAKDIAQEQAAEKERQRLDAVKQAFVAGEFIKKEDFISLCQQAGIKIPLRTHGTLNKNVVELSYAQGIKYLKIAKKAKPDLTGCYKLIHQYMCKISPQADKS